jgi:hypothetical protein
MSAYLFTFRSPDRYAPDSGTFEEWSRWQLELGVRLMDRGNPAFASAVVGAEAASTTLGGYSVIRATSLDAALGIARGCPLLRYGGGVEVGELTSHDERFDQWLAGQFRKDGQS